MAEIQAVQEVTVPVGPVVQPVAEPADQEVIPVTLVEPVAQVEPETGQEAVAQADRKVVAEPVPEVAQLAEPVAQVEQEPVEAHLVETVV